VKLPLRRKSRLDTLSKQLQGVRRPRRIEPLQRLVHITHPPPPARGCRQRLLLLLLSRRVQKTQQVGCNGWIVEERLRHD
jgi:hypothetical protein